MVRERYTPDGVPEWQVIESRDVRIAARRAPYLSVESVPYHSVGFFRKVWKVVSGY